MVESEVSDPSLVNIGLPLNMLRSDDHCSMWDAMCGRLSACSTASWMVLTQDSFSRGFSARNCNFLWVVQVTVKLLSERFATEEIMCTLDCAT